MASRAVKSRRRGPICLTTGGIIVSKSAAAFARARTTFKREHCLMLPGFLAPAFLKLVRKEVARLEFRRQVHAGFGSDLTPSRNNVAGALVFMMNDRRLFEAIERITGCVRLRTATGSLRRAVAGAGNVLSWHDDNSRNRRVAMTINLSARRYRGGLLQIREKKSGRIVKELANTGPGDAVLFRVSSRLEHRNTEIIGKSAKTAFSGWFHDTAGFDSVDKRIASARGMRGRARNPVALAATSRIVAARETLVKNLGDHTVLLSLASGGAYRLNHSGAQMFALMKRATTPREIATAIAAQYGIASEIVERDSIPMFGELAAHGLIRKLA